jgi:hypothetical protein
MHRLRTAEKLIMDFVHEKTFRVATPETLKRCEYLRNICTLLALIDMADARAEAGVTDPWTPAITKHMEALRRIFISSERKAPDAQTSEPL